MEFSLRELPFSTFGSYMAVAYFERYDSHRKGLYLKTVGGGTQGQDFCNIAPVFNGEVLSFKEEASPTSVTLTTENGSIEMCFPSADELRIRGKGVDFALFLEKPGGYSFAAKADKKTVIINFNVSKKIAVKVLQGAFDIISPWDESGYGCSEVKVTALCDPETGMFEIAVTDFYNSYKPLDCSLSFEQCLLESEKKYNSWMAKTPAVPLQYAAAAEIAMYLIWSSSVSPRGLFKRNVVLMSKNYMNSLWSWDHCFNAMALAFIDFDLSWNQFMVPFDFQDIEGNLQDAMTDRSYVANFVKPPVHGWTLRRLMETSDIGDEKLKEIYEPLCRWTDWWFAYMDFDSDGIPQYMHGNDSGWDNSTAFRFGTPVESPDLAAFLIYQMDVLSDIAEHLDKKSESDLWREKADKTLQLFIDKQSDGKIFYAVKNGEEEWIQTDSLINCLPVLLGKRLPEGIRRGLVEKIKLFITDYGLATEKPDSVHYTSDGYWRGPIWAPPTLIVVDGLIAMGENDLAKEIAVKFCDMCARSGMAENFNALTGEGLRDLSYTWTASVFLILAGYLENGVL